MELFFFLNIILEECSLLNGFELIWVSVFLGVIGIVFELRFNVIFDVFVFCLKLGNVFVLKGSCDVYYFNIVIVKLIYEVLEKRGLKNVCYLVFSEREVLFYIL